jgi:hypothetical protein
MENRLVLENGGDGDFGPLLPGGHELRLQVPAGSIAEGLPGDFSSLTALRDGRPVPVSFATEIVLRFARLPAGSSLRSGPLLPFAKNLAQTATLDHNPLQRTPE